MTRRRPSAPAAWPRPVLAALLILPIGLSAGGAPLRAQETASAGGQLLDQAPLVAFLVPDRASPLSLPETAPLPFVEPTALPADTPQVALDIAAAGRPEGVTATPVETVAIESGEPLATLALPADPQALPPLAIDPPVPFRDPRASGWDIAADIRTRTEQEAAGQATTDAASSPAAVPVPPPPPAARTITTAEPAASAVAAAEPAAEMPVMLAGLAAPIGPVPLPLLRPPTPRAMAAHYDQVAMLLPPAGVPSPPLGFAGGCGLAASDGTIEVAGRRVLIDVPSGYDPRVPTRLILAFHGRTGSPERVQGYYNLDTRPADGSRGPQAIIAYPQASSAGWGGRVTADLEFTAALLAEMERRFCIDSTQIFAVGHSMGGSFVNTLACSMPRAFRGVASVAGGGSVTQRCESAPVAQILLHNPADDFVAYSLSEGELSRRLSQNGLVQTVSARSDEPFPCRRYGAQGPEPVIFCDLPSTTNRHGRVYRHGWPEGTGETILAFFDSLPPRR